jgi:hypothetical protein
MSQAALTNTERIMALRRFGYTEPEASFLCLAALQGGYFLRRQYAGFLGRKDGGNVTQLIQKALAQGHLRSSTWRQNTQLYHVCARPFYEALGQGDNRNRRPREFLAIKNKVMCLDFVLAHREFPYLTTEREKLEYFTGTLELDPSRLPSKLYHSARSDRSTVRCFVDKYPMFLAPGRQGSDPLVVSFCFVDEGLAGLSRFETYLVQYGPLLRSLAEFRLIYVAASQVHFTEARRLFNRFAGQGPDTNGTTGGAPLERLLDYFETRHLYETKQFASFDRAKLIRLREARQEFSGRQNETLYEQWRTGGRQAMSQILMPKLSLGVRICGRFSTYLLEHDYGLFGGFPGR